MTSAPSTAGQVSSVPKVSIVLPTYKRLDYLQIALPSALAQTYAAFEVIVSDDSASPAIAAYVASLADPRIRYRSNPRNLGIALNNWAAFAEARGSYIANLHDDDIWEPTFLEIAVAALDADPAVSVAFCDHHVIDAAGQLVPEATAANSQSYGRDRLAAGRHQPFYHLVVAQTIPMVMGAVFRKAILQPADYSRRVGGAYDYWLSYLAARHGAAAYYLPERLTRYRVHGGSDTSTGGLKTNRAANYVRTQILHDPAYADYRRTLANSLGVSYGKTALRCLTRRRFRRAWVLEKRAFSLIRSPKNIGGLLKNTAVALYQQLSQTYP